MADKGTYVLYDEDLITRKRIGNSELIIYPVLNPFTGKHEKVVDEEAHNAENKILEESGQASR